MVREGGGGADRQEERDRAMEMDVRGETLQFILVLGYSPY